MTPQALVYGFIARDKIVVADCSVTRLPNEIFDTMTTIWWWRRGIHGVIWRRYIRRQQFCCELWSSRSIIMLSSS